MLRFPPLCLFMCAFASSAWAQAQAPVPPALAEPAPQLWINLGGFSHHPSGNNFNERNTGLGVEWRTSASISYMAGVYRNSVGRNTQYAALNWQPLQMGLVRIGAAIGVMNGYPSIAHGGSFFAALPFLSLEGEHLGVNVGLIPKTGKVQSAAIVQFKLRLL